ncbi:MAG: MFS transporter [Acidobacteria bacterium]|nr:MFS transporter [Acidobacteriota bacterium]
MTEGTAAKKWTVVALLWGAHFMTFVIRVSLGVVAPTLMGLYQISPKEMGYVLAGWNWIYTAGVIMVGPVVDRFGPWMVMGLGSAVWGVSTLALPVATTALSLFVMRSLYGFGHCMLIPAGAAGITRWFGPAERATAIGLVFSAGTIGSALGAAVAAFLLDQMGWQAVFYAIGAASLVLTVLWFILYPDKKLGPSRRHGATEAGVRVPWRLLLRYRSTWGIAFGQMGYLYALFFFVTWMPGYLIMERKMSVLRTGLVAGLPFWAGMAGTIGGGWLGDYLMRRGFSRTASRKGMIGVGMTLATISVVSAAFTTETWLAVTLLTLCMGFLRMTTASNNATAMDLAPPNSVASLTSIQSFGGNLVGLLAPIVTGYIVQSTGSFVWALVVAGGMAMFGACSYVFIVGRLEPLPIILSRSESRSRSTADS